MKYTKNQRKVINVSISVVVISIIMLAITLVVMVSTDRNMMKDSQQNEDLERVKIEQQEVVTQFITNFYDYNKENYVSRMQEVEKVVSPDVFHVLMGGETIDSLENSDAANLDFSSEVISMYVYAHDTATIRGHVHAIIEYKMITSGIEHESRNMIYDFEVQKNSKDKWVISDISMLGEGVTEKLT